MLVELSLQQMLTRIVAMVLASGVHGFALALVAQMLGDAGPRHEGRRTLNPFAHVSVLGLVSAVVSQAGWIVPIRLDAARPRFAWLGPVVFVFAGAVTLVVFATAVIAMRPGIQSFLSPTGARYGITLMTTIAEICVGTAALSLVPVPPFAGAQIWRSVAPNFADGLTRHTTSIALLWLAVLYFPRGGWLSPLTEPLLALVYLAR